MEREPGDGWDPDHSLLPGLRVGSVVREDLSSPLSDFEVPLDSGALSGVSEVPLGGVWGRTRRSLPDPGGQRNLGSLVGVRWGLWGYGSK